MSKVVIAVSKIFCVLGLILAAVIVLVKATSATELKLSASVQADLSGDPLTEPQDYTLVAESAEAASRIAGALRPRVPKLDYQDGRVLSLSSAQIKSIMGAIPAGSGVVAIDRSQLLGLGTDKRTSTVPFSKNARLSHNVPQLCAAYNLTGKGIGVGVWDVGSVLASHVEFDNRVELRDPDQPPVDHSTQVAGNIAASGDVAKGGEDDAKGVAPASRIYSFVWKDDIQKLRRFAEAEPEVYITNHSYSATRGWAFVRAQGLWGWYGDPRVSPTEDHAFGKYDVRSSDIDAVVADFPRLSVFVAAGNNRDPQAHPKARDPTWDGLHWLPVLRKAETDPTRPPDRQHDGGYDTMEDLGVAKNVITIGAMEDIAKGKSLTPENVRVTEFSNWGPTDDGRIKPDLVANGSDLRAPGVSKIGNGYDRWYHANKDGTSMASPTAAGVAALLTELSITRRHRPMRGNEMKAVLIATAVSPQREPTYRTGWGAIDAAAAGTLVAGEKGGLTIRVANGNPIEIKLARTSGPMNLTIAWIDPPAAANVAGLNDRTPTLVLDFDLVLIDPAGKPHFPWSLDPDRPAAQATNSGPNHRDNVERIDVFEEYDAAGIWSAKITAPAEATGHEVAVAFLGFKILE